MTYNNKNKNKNKKKKKKKKKKLNEKCKTNSLLVKNP